jgi:pimeloyl-ACP methyl ester carboxylesterase
VEVVADDGVRLRLTVAGEGTRRVLLVHGWMVSSAVWSYVIPALAGRDCTVATLDLRGAGGSDRPESGYSIERHAADVDAAVRALGWDGFAIAGHSMGGAIVQRYAVGNHRRLDAQVLVAPVPADGVDLPDSVVVEFRAATSTAENAERFMRDYVSAPLSQERWRELVADSCDVSQPAVSEGLDAWRGCRFAADLGDIHLPTLVVGGADDPNFTPQVLRDRVVSRWPGARLVVLDGANHYVPIDAPQALAQAILGFLEDR